MTPLERKLIDACAAYRQKILLLQESRPIHPGLVERLKEANGIFDEALCRYEASSAHQDEDGK